MSRPRSTASSPCGKVGIVGYCWGGYVTWMAAARAKGLACAVDYYGTQTLDAQDDIRTAR